jgi:hypothetical protein
MPRVVGLDPPMTVDFAGFAATLITARASTAASACDPVCVSTPITIM